MAKHKSVEVGLINTLDLMDQIRSLKRRVVSAEQKLSEVIKDRDRLIIERLMDEWQYAVSMDLENGVSWMNDEASKEFAEKYPNISKFGELLKGVSDGLSPASDS